MPPTVLPSPPPRQQVVYLIALFVLGVLGLFLLVGIGMNRSPRHLAPVPPEAPRVLELNSTQSAVLAPLSVHGVQHIETQKEGVYFDAPGGRVYFALYHRGGFDPSTSRTRSEHLPDGTWKIEGDVTTKSGRFFNFRATAGEFETVTANGQAYDLRLGRVLLLTGDGKVQQLPLFPSSITIQTIPGLAEEIDRLNSAEDLNRPAALASKPQITSELKPGEKQPPPPPNPLFTMEKQVVVPANSRVSLELFRQKNDVDRASMGRNLVFKTAARSGLGVVVRWYAYGPEHKTHANRWIVDLLDPQDGTIFYRREEGFGEPVTMAAMDGAAPGSDEPSTLIQSGSWVFIRLLRAEGITTPDQPVRNWWEIHAFVILHAELEQGNPAEFQLRTVVEPK